MCGRAYDPRFLWMWPGARISVMGGTQAADVLVQIRRDAAAAQGQPAPEAELEALRRETVERYDQDGDPYVSTARLWDDGILDPLDTRAALGLALAAACHGPFPPTRFGVFRF
jgi:acetyl-CoA carboxylase carboxyltransferase component